MTDLQNGERAAAQSRRKSYISLSLFGVGLTLYTLVFAEAFLRAFSPQAILPRYVTGTPWGVRGNVPDADYWHRTPEVTVEYRINHQGMRADREYSIEKPQGVCRVAIFGDSFFMGYELNLEDTFAFRLERHLNSVGIRSEVLNFSVSGFGTAEMIQTYEGFGRQFEPDVVIFEWHDSDLEDNVRSGMFRVSNGVLERGARTYLPGVSIQDALMKSTIYRIVADNSHLYTFVRERAARKAKELLIAIRMIRTRATQSEAHAQDDDADREAEDVKPYASVLAGKLLQYAHDLVVAEHRDFVVVDVPRRTSRTSYNSSLYLIPQETRANLKFLTPLHELVAAANPETKLYSERGHDHLTPLGVDALMRAVVGPIEASHSFDRCRSDR